MSLACLQCFTFEKRIVQAGNNQTFENVLVNTGSAILWVGAGELEYVPGAYTQVYEVSYVNGTAYIDRVAIGEATATSQIIGAAAYYRGFTLLEPLDGVFGLGPSGSNDGDVSGYNATPTFVETLHSEGVIERAVFGLYVNPMGLDGTPQSDGEITFGGVDESRISGNITWFPQTPSS
ncbi:hypothetical protein AcW2_006881 [Taiwanofungus camphoratus]|nr:hypothetical protein AcW2_006881 [Antrodia cinnamomea]